MLDDLRNTPVPENESPLEYDEGETREPDELILFGLNAPQRFAVVFLLFMMTVVLGALCLIVTERVVLPVFY